MKLLKRKQKVNTSDEELLQKLSLLKQQLILEDSEYKLKLNELMDNKDYHRLQGLKDWHNNNLAMFSQEVEELEKRYHQA